MKYGKDVRFYYRRRYSHPYTGEPLMASVVAIKEALFGHRILPTGGEVHCDLLWDGEVYATGVALCSERDNFCYRVGREIAYGRALKEAERKLKGSAESNEGKIRVHVTGDAGTDVAGLSELEDFGWGIERRPGGITLYPPVQSGT